MRQKNPDGRMPLFDHLKEARQRILKAVIGIALAAVGGWYLYRPTIEILSRPLKQVAAAEGRLAELNFGTVISGFDMQMRVALYLGFFIASPWWIYQIWAFIAPGLTKKEKRYTIGFAAAAVPLMAAGAALAWWVLPQAVQIMLSFVPKESASLMDAKLYFTFCLRLIAVLALSFLLPVIMVGINMVGLICGRTYLSWWRWALVGILIFAALASPLGDPWSLMLLATPIYLLYLGSCVIALFVDRRRKKKLAERDARIDAGLEI
ncbi:twin arginine-targeting protein translocase TatC [Bowdeniella nasicola]|uniref:Sec-independent protein translocase protein TatC n=1 Tax=Bowdeniella nasicola TaxID=208480 RepID=A0A1Q5Q370_9ACTO|nr:twin-arginine translocase subunit TatC [Bowdeniella nasicola]OKL54284.1 twin arginine-targeting protein translocase TatC [Bowdeniella nasicola]